MVSMQLLLLMGFFGCQKGKAKHPAPNCPAPAKGGVKSLLAQVKTIPSHGAVPAASEEAFLERKRAQRRRHKACSVDVLKGSIVHGTWHARCNGAISTALRHIHPPQQSRCSESTMQILATKKGSCCFSWVTQTLVHCPWHCQAPTLCQAGIPAGWSS